MKKNQKELRLTVDKLLRVYNGDFRDISRFNEGLCSNILEDAYIPFKHRLHMFKVWGEYRGFSPYTPVLDDCYNSVIKYTNMYGYRNETGVNMYVGALGCARRRFAKHCAEWIQENLL